ncbi:Spc98 family-domain-containing protein [Corynascus novoguineensis]|uniref:Spindle pole body component n=1 Tax=Corynascus novoguineensis TaxID=1126955 RepID=A0AAN7HE93_9PEZI|nr:Spc98 family-domain-containing protein [Corynascus novoguineensis]
MADEEDPSNLFAVPELWRPSTWLDHTVDDSKTHHPLFSLHLSGASHPLTSPNLIEASTIHAFNGAGNQDDVFFKLPSLLKELVGQDLQIHTTKTDEPGVASVEHPEFEPELSTASDDEDLWLSHDNDSARPSFVRTWESFEQHEQERGPPLFISEAGPIAFDALLASSQGAGDVPDVSDAAPYCACLRNLALGRSSILFTWDSGKKSFVKTVPCLRISGLSLDSVKAIDNLCLDCGNSARQLQLFAEGAYSAASTPTQVALARVVGCLVAVVRSELSNNSRAVKSILQLKSAVQPAQLVLSYFKNLVKKLAQQNSDEGLLSCLFQEAQASEYREILLKEATREVLRIVSRPWTDLVEEWIGVKPEEGIPLDKMGSGKGFVRVADKTWIDDQGYELEEADYFLEEDRLPTFVPGNMAQSIFEAGRNLRFLREHHPEHPLSRPDVICSALSPRLEWQFDWEAVSKLEAKVNQYRNAVSRLVAGGLPGTHGAAVPSRTNKRKYDAAELEYFGRDEAEVQAKILASIRQLNQPLQDPEPQDELSRLLQDHLYRAPADQSHSDSLSPHWTLVPLLSFGPIVEAQSNLINHECMKLLFSSHHLRTHLDLLKQYFLLSNGLLVSRLTHALFNPDLSTAERRSGVALGSGTMGLRLGGRQTWPPASSELRLALMGVLSECYESVTTTTAPRNSSPNLPGDLSFAVRNLSPQEIERCMDPHSLEALDFLRLSYKPPRALRAVITPAILSKYDRVFKLLLRVLRMLYVANYNLSHHRRHHNNRGTGEEEEHEQGEGVEEDNLSRRFRIEARHFVHQVAAYFFDVGIGEPWGRFEQWLDAVQAHALQQTELTSAAGGHDPSAVPGVASETEAKEGTVSSTRARAKTTTSSPDVLRERQERALDEIMGALLLRKRQAPVMGLLEETFGIVLKFARVTTKTMEVGVHHGKEGGEGGETVKELYRLFRKKVEVFITVLKGLGEKMAVSSSSAVAAGTNGGRGLGKGDGACVEQLLLRLDMAGFYGRHIGG